MFKSTFRFGGPSRAARNCIATGITLALTLGVLSTAAFGQTYPTFAESRELSNTLHRSSSTVGASPALIQFNSTLFMAYADSSSGYLDIATSTDGSTFSGPSSTSIYLGVDNSPALGIFNGALYVAYIYSGQLYTASSSNGFNFSSPTLVNVGLTLSGKPALQEFNNLLYLAFTAYNGSTGYTNVYFVKSNSAGSFSGAPCVTVSTDALDYQSVSSPTTVLYDNNLKIIWLTGQNRYPVVASYVNTLSFSIAKTTGIQIGGDPAAVDYNGGFFIFGRSYYSSNNLWAIGTTNGVNFETQQEYGQTLTNSPGVATFNSFLVQAGRSNYGSNIWVYTANH